MATKNLLEELFQAAQSYDRANGPGAALYALQHLNPSGAVFISPKQMKSAAPKSPKLAGKVTRWVLTDGRGRVPNFVLEIASAKDKADLLKHYPLGSSFELGKPLPPKKGTTFATDANVVTQPRREEPKALPAAKPPIHRKKKAS